MEQLRLIDEKVWGARRSSRQQSTPGNQDPTPDLGEMPGQRRPASTYIEEADEIGRARQAAADRAGNSTPRFTADRTYENRLGAKGEVQFSRDFGVPMAAGVARDGRGDDGYDFVTIAGTINVKTAQFPKYLPAKVKEVHKADIYVIGREGNPIEWVGWATREEMLTHKPMVLREDNPIPSHCRPWQLLRSMSSLRALLDDEANRGW